MLLKLDRCNGRRFVHFAGIAFFLAANRASAQTPPSCATGTVPMPVDANGKLAQANPVKTKCVTPQEAMQMVMESQAEMMKKLGGQADPSEADNNALPTPPHQPESDPVLGSSASIATALESGRLVLRAARFSADGSSMTAPTGALIQSIADAMKKIGGLFAVEAHVPMNGASWSTARAVSGRQAQAFRNAIVSAGVPGTNVAAVGYGAGRPEKANDANPRIEIVRLR